MTRDVDKMSSNAPPSDNDGQDPKTTGPAPGYGNTMDFAYQTLKERVLDGSLQPGQRLNETELAKELNVSRTPIREAIQRLSVDGLVEPSSSRGVVVAELTPEEVEDLYATRAVLEGLAARLAAGRMSDYERVILSEIQQQMEDALDSKDSERLAQVNFAFHVEILRISRNATAQKFMEQIHNALRRYGTTTLSLPERAATAVTEHRQLLEALAKGDGEKAEVIARSHIQGALQVRLQILARRHLASREERR